MAIPLKLKILLVRETHLKFGRDAIAPMLAEKEAEYQALEKDKPGMFASKEKKQAHLQQLAEAMETLRLLRNGIAQLDRVEPHIKRMVEEEAESFLRASSPAYLTALATRQHREDWIKCLDRFGEKVYGLKQALGNVRNMACSGYQREAQSFSQASGLNWQIGDIEFGISSMQPEFRNAKGAYREEIDTAGKRRGAGTGGRAHQAGGIRDSQGGAEPIDHFPRRAAHGPPSRAGMIDIVEHAASRHGTSAYRAS